MGRQYRFTVADGGSLTFAGKVTHTTCGRLEMTVDDGGSLAFNGSEAKIGGQNSTGVVTVARGGRISGNLALGCGANGCAELMVDGGTAEFSTLEIGKDALADASFVVTNGAEVSSTTLNLRKGSLDLPSGIAWTNSGTARIGYEIGAKTHMTVREGATFRVLRQLDVGSGNGEGTLDILGGTVWQRDPNDNYVYTYIANKAASTGTVNLVSGLFKVRGLYCGQRGLGVFNISGGKFESDFVYFPYSEASDAQAEVNVSGGEFYVTDSLGIGYSGAAEMNVSGGEVSANYFFLGQGGASVQNDWAVLRQTGGYIKTRKSFYDATTGVKLADADGRNTKLILDGGRLCTYHIFGNRSRAAGGTGYAALSANGGTVETPFAINAAFIEKLDEAKLGARGLTVKSDYACTIPQDFTDADNAAGEGLLVLAGIGLKTITATNSTVSRVDIAGGTVLFSPSALGVQAVQHSAITVTNNATFSLEGDQTSLTLRSLVLGNAESVGRLKLDVGDVIRVEGALTVNSGLLQVSDGFEVGNEYGVIELLGAEDRSAELEAALALLHADSSAVGRGYSFRTEYDQATGKTTAKLVVAELPVSGTTSWRGPGSNWETDANWSDGAPGMADVAVFDSGTAPDTVSITGQKQVGGIVFNASQGYTLAGGCPSSLSTKRASTQRRACIPWNRGCGCPTAFQLRWRAALA